MSELPRKRLTITLDMRRRPSTASTSASNASEPRADPNADEVKRLTKEALVFYGSAGWWAAVLSSFVVAMQTVFLALALACPSEGHPLCLQAVVIGLSVKWIISVLWHPELKQNWIPHALVVCVIAQTLVSMWAVLRQPEVRLFWRKAPKQSQPTIGQSPQKSSISN